jgi:psp operon transcriptional activator
MESARTPPELIGQSPVFLDALAHASTAAALDRPLLVTGERGSGKELLAGRIHFLSPRWGGPFIKVNCAALSEDLLESELFGHEAGAFTGARGRHRGRFERAEGGTIFLDEIASASLRVQEKLLRIIEYGEFERLGGDDTLIADVRVVAAANIDLPAYAEAGKFRADLLDRLAFDVIHAPPLRERKEDIPLLAAHFASTFAREIGVRGETVRFDGFTPQAMTAFAAHDWPGNVRELKNAAERSFYRWIAAGQAGPVDAVVIDAFGGSFGNRQSAIGSRAPSAGEARELSAAPGAPDSRLPIPDTRSYDLRARLDEVERDWVSEALIAHNWSQKRAADFLKLSYDQMRGLVRKHGLSQRSA